MKPSAPFKAAEPASAKPAAPPVKPSAPVKPPVPAKATEQAKPGQPAEPTDKPVEPAAQAKPGEPVAPQVKSSAQAEPAAGSEPPAGVKPAVGVEPASGVEPAADVKPAAKGSGQAAPRALESVPPPKPAEARPLPRRPRPKSNRPVLVPNDSSAPDAPATDQPADQTKTDEQGNRRLVSVPAHPGDGEQPAAPAQPAAAAEGPDDERPPAAKPHAKPEATAKQAPKTVGSKTAGKPLAASKPTPGKARRRTPADDDATLDELFAPKEAPPAPVSAEPPAAEPTAAESANDQPAETEPAGSAPAAVAVVTPAPATVAVPVRPRPAPAAPSRAASGLAAAFGFLAAFALIVWGLRGTASAPPPADVESERAARAFALARLGVTNLTDSWPADTAAALQIATYSLWRGLIGPTSALVQARETMLVASVISALLVWALVRRLGLSTPAAIAASFLTALTPWALSAHRLVEPANLAVPWLLAGFLLSTPKTRRRIVAGPAALCLAIAVATSPLVGVILLAGLAASYAIGDAGERWSTPRRVVVVSALAVAAALLLATLAGVFGDRLALADTVALPDPGPVDTVLAIAAVVASLAALRIRWLQPFALVFIVLATSAAALPDPVRTPALLLAVPAGAVLLAALAESAVQWLAGAWRFGTMPRRLAAVGIAVIVLVTGGVAATAAPDSYPSAESDGGIAARRWIENNLPDESVLVADDVVWPELVDAGIHTDRLVSYTGLGDSEKVSTQLVQAALDGKAGAPQVFVIGQRTSGLDSSVVELARIADQRSLPMARMGPGLRTEIRQVFPDPGGTQRVTSRETVTRRLISLELAQNPGLVMTGEARTALAAGQVDPRLLSVLASLAARQRIGIAAFPPASGESGVGTPETAPLRRRVRITSVDGAPIAASAASTQLLQRWLAAQLPPYRPASAVIVAGQGLNLTYLAPSPTGLLGR